MKQSHYEIAQQDVSQEQIVAWFNKIYSKKGRGYLRPVKAYSVFLTLLQATSQHKLLDVACGMGCLLEAAQNRGCDLHGIDISSVALDTAKQHVPNASLQLANAEAIPLQDNSFDLITCLGSLERMLDLPKVLGELRRLGKSDARYCFLVRNANTAIWKYLKMGLAMRNKEGHQGAKTLAQWHTVFDENGFVVDGVYPDQYPLHKKQKWSSLGLRKVDYGQVVSSKKPLEQANEFIFILRKASV